jgi:putative adhesin
VKPHVVLFTAFCLAATACTHAGSDEQLVWSGEMPAGSVVHLRNGSGEIQVRPASGQGVVVNGERQWRHGRARDVQFIVTHAGNDYFVCAMWRNSGNCAAKGYRGKSTGGFLSMFSLFHRGTDASARLIADVPANVTVDARTSNGSVTINGIAAGVTAHTANGNVDATNVSGPVSLQSTNGNVRLSADSLAAADPISLSTTNGNISAQLPTNTEGIFDLSVVNGSVRSDLPLAPGRSGVGRHLQGQIGTSNRVVKMRSVNGGVTVTTHPANASHE